MNKLKFIQDLSIKNKIIAIILLVTILTMSVGFIFIAIWDINRLKSDIQSNLVLNAKLVGNYCVVPLTFGDNEQATEVLSRLQYIESIEKGCLYDKDGNLFATFPDSAKASSSTVLTEQQNNIFKGGYFHVREPIMFQNEMYGTLYIEANSNPLTSTKRIIMLTLSMVTLVLVFLAIFLAGIMQLYISLPILKLKIHFDDMSENQDFTSRIEKQSNDEIGSLYDGFNNLLEQIQIKRKERDLVMEKLQTSTEKLNLALSGGETGIWEWDLKTDIITWDARMEKIFGLDVGSFKQNYEAFKELLHPDDIVNAGNAIKNALDGIEPYNTIYRAIWKNNETKYIKAQAMISRDEDQNPLIMTGICIDVTEIKKAEEELKKHQENLEELVIERTEKLEEKNKELENMNNVFVDREYRIKEMKDRLKKFENNPKSK